MSRLESQTGGSTRLWNTTSRSWHVGPSLKCRILGDDQEAGNGRWGPMKLPLCHNPYRQQGGEDHVFFRWEEAQNG